MNRRGLAAGFVLLPVMLLLSLVAAMAYLGNRETTLASATARGATDRDMANYMAEAGLNRAIVQMHDKGCGGSYPIFLLSPVQDTAFNGGRYYAYASKTSGSPVTITSTGTYGDVQITLTRQNVPMHQATSTTVTLQPGTAGVDTHVQSGSSTNNGAATALDATLGTAYALLNFDLSAIPAGAHVTSATLSAYATGGGGSGSGQVALHRMTRDWTEAATWNTSNGSAPWGQAGGDVNMLALASASFTSANNWLNWDVTALADRWIKGSLPNQGVQLRAAAGISGLELASSDATNATQRPKLAVTFLPPCGWTPPDTVVTLSPQADTDINFNIPTTNFGSEPDLYLSKGYEAHPLLQFDVTGIAAGKLVKSATLRLYFGGLNVNTTAATQTTKSLTLNVHAVTRTWKELEATWRRRISGTNWTTQGGDYRITATATKTLPTNTVKGVWLEFAVGPLVQEWVDGVTTNNGLLLVLPTSSTEELLFNSREAASNRPELVVTYQ